MMRFWNRIDSRRIKEGVRREWRKFLAATRISLQAVCEESHGMGLYDYHDYPDSDEGRPWDFHTLTCRRCGKDFAV